MNTNSKQPSIPERLTRCLRHSFCKVPITCLLLLQFVLWSVQVRGAPFSWDGNSGDWNIANPQWNGGTLWVNDGAGDAIFGGTPGTVTATIPINLNSLTFNSSGYLVQGSSLNMAFPSITVTNLGDTATVASEITGSFGLAVNGLGRLILSGNNTFIGGVNLGDGILQLGSPGALNSNAVSFGAAATGVLRLAGNSVALGGLSTDPTNPGTAAVENASATPAVLQVNQPATTVSTFGGQLRDGTGGGALSLAKTGNGSLVLTNSSNSFTGDVSIKSGIVVISDGGQLGSGTTAISVTGIANTGNPGYSGGSLILAGPGTGAGMTLNREVSVSGRGPGAANATGGLISVGNNTIAGGLVVASGASEGRVLATHGITTISGGLDLGAGAAQVFYGNGNYVISGQVTGSEIATDRFIKTGLILGTTLWLQNANNNFAQSLRIDSGTVRVSDNAALGRNLSPQSVDLLNGMLEVRTDSPTGFATRNVFARDNASANIFVDHALGSSLINQTVTFGNLRAANTNNTFNFSSRNGYGASFVGAGGLIGGGGANNTVFNNNSSGLLTLTANLWNQNDATARTLTISGSGDTVVTGDILAPNAALHVFTKNGIGTLTLGGAAGTYKGATNILGGTLSISNVGAVALTSQINIGNATTTSGGLTYTGPTATLNKNLLLNTTTANVFINASGSGPLTLTGTILNTVNGAHTLVLGGTNTNDNTVNSVIPINSTPATITSLQKIGVGTWVLNPTANNTFTGSTTVSNGT
ncbi:MAG: autotransporter-associated beta strand repeat-containing protein, partial [Prosthecobacter sp.]|nr:autotransporter-associated beta strand repeat-containing protein [Prosthecobacter sp.]